MNYDSLNESQKNKVKYNINSIHYEWENKNFIEILLGKLPQLHFTDINQTQIKKELIQLYNSYDFFTTDHISYLSQLKIIHNQLLIQNKHYFDYDEFEKTINFHKSLLINGEGGKGKTYFLFKLEEKLSEKNIKHLCIYGKYLDDINVIDFTEISRISSQEEFVLIIDAYNELNENIQNDLLSEIPKLLLQKGFRIIISYRDYRLQNTILKSLVALLKNQYCFEGVSYEAALDTLSTTGFNELYQYSDILYSNNALFISFLIKALEDTKQKAKSPKFNSIVSMTNILEQEIKNTVGDIYWKNTKKIADWMYQNNTKEIPITQVGTLVNNSNQFIHDMKASGYFSENNKNSTATLKFTLEALSDSIISRSLLNDLSNKNENDIIVLLNSKISYMPELTKMFIIVLFDKFTPDYSKISRILNGTGIKIDLTPDLIIKLNIQSKNIKEFQKHFNFLNSPTEYLIYCSGYYNKPFNCTNYINEYLIKNKGMQLYPLSQTLSEYYDIHVFTKRLKNILYFVNRINISDKMYRDEIIFTALWGTAAPNNSVHLLSKKLLYEMVNLYDDNISLLISIYDDIEDIYIKQSIIHVLSKMPENDEIKNFLEKLRSDDDNVIGEESIQLICNYLNINIFDFFKKKRRILIHSNKPIEQPLEKLLTTVYHHHIDSHFRYLGNANIDQIYPKFLQNTHRISLYNKFVSFLDKHGFRISELKKPQKIPPKYLLNSLDFQIKRICRIYGLENNYLSSQNNYVNDFKNTLMRKIFSISQSILYGYLTGTHYTDNFVYEPSDSKSTGYNFYNPFEYDEDTNNICSPICIYQSLIENLEDTLYKTLQIKINKDKSWGEDDVNLKSNLRLLLSPFSFNGTEWHLLAGQIKITDINEKWEEYNLISCNSNLNLKLEEPEQWRQLTIEKKYYNDNIKLYNKCQKDWECLKVNFFNAGNNILDETELVLPPASLLQLMNLHYVQSSCTWNNEKNEIIIVCNNNKYQYKGQIFSGDIFIRNDYYVKYNLDKKLKFFIYTERRLDPYGFFHETSHHIEYFDNTIINEVYNY